MSHTYPKEAVKDVLAILDHCGATITTLLAYFAFGRDPSVTICFETAEDLESFAERDGAKVTVTEKGTASSPVIDHWAMYERPGRRMLIQYIETGRKS